MTITELDESLRQFYAAARNKEGENYSRATLLSLRNGIERFLNSHFGVAVALKVSEAWKEAVLHLMLMLKATILCRWRTTKARKTTQAEFQT